MIKIILSTFFIVFLAELGDKTQLATMLISSNSNSPAAVFIGSSLALIASSFLGVLIGNILYKYIPQWIIQSASGVVFIILGFIILFIYKK